MMGRLAQRMPPSGSQADSAPTGTSSPVVRPLVSYVRFDLTIRPTPLTGDVGRALRDNDGESDGADDAHPAMCQSVLM